ncbi:MAG: TolC family protein [Leptospiraceae bacterium]|nr:TolC family protein [Leptospiraceae bacterium]
MYPNHIYSLKQIIIYFCKIQFYLFWLGFGFLTLLAQPASEEKKVIKLSVEEAVKYVLENNPTIQTAKFEILKSDTPYYKNESQFSWRVVGGVEVVKSKAPSNRNNVFSGNRFTQDAVKVGIEKQFKTGTYFKAEVSNVRYDSNAFEGSSSSQFSFLAVPPMYTGALSLTISQELLKNSFGKTEENTRKMLQLEAVIKREELLNQLTGLVAKTLVDYWSLSIAESAVTTYEKLLKSTINIRNLTVRKQRIGLAETYEIHQWNSVVSQIRSMLETAKNRRDEAKRNLIRVLNVDPRSEIQGVTQLTEELPGGYQLEKDIDYAYEHRIDLQNLRRQMMVTKYGLSNAEAEDVPSLKISGTYKSLGQSIESPSDNFTSMDRGIPSTKYNNLSAQIALSYPLWDKGIKSAIRDSNIEVSRLRVLEEDLRKQIKDELHIRHDNIQKSYVILQNSKRTELEAERFYNGIYRRFSQGSYNALSVKKALDNYVESQLGTIQARVNFNINMLLYDLSKNYLFERFGVDVRKVMNQLLSKNDEFMK